ncbi:MAG: hypothetical protein O6934_01410 [SAR324 cluster bacterium]|nr:hypothetical protein [SAR324 cluster bacterium]
MLFLLRSETYRAAGFLAAASKLRVALVVASDRPHHEPSPSRLSK